MATAHAALATAHSTSTVLAPLRAMWAHPWPSMQSSTQVRTAMRNHHRQHGVCFDLVRYCAVTAAQRRMTTLNATTLWGLGGPSQHVIAHASIIQLDTAYEARSPFFTLLRAAVPVLSAVLCCAGTSICGQCVKYRGVGRGLGGNPVSGDWQPGFICDQCPECSFGDIDMQKGGDGRWKVEW